MKFWADLCLVCDNIKLSMKRLGGTVIVQT